MEYKLDFKTYSNALKENRLLGLRCHECTTVTCPPQLVCGECAGGDVSVVELTGKGKIITFTTTHVAPLGRETEAPYTIVMVALEEGPWLIGNLVGVDPADTDMNLIGKKVKLGHKVFPGDSYSDGEAARPLFSFE